MKFRSNAVIRTLASLIALVFCVASSAFATPLYTVAWYANPAVTNVAYAAASVSANDADSPRLSAAWAAVASDANIAGQTVVAKRMSHTDYFRPRLYVLLGNGTIVIYTLTEDLSEIKWTTVFSSADLIARVNANGGSLETGRTITAFEVVDKDGAVAFVKFGNDADYVALANTPPKWTYYADGAPGNPSPGSVKCITDGRWVLKCLIDNNRVRIGSWTTTDSAYVTDYRSEYLDLSQGTASSGSDSMNVFDCVYSLANGPRVIIHSSRLNTTPSSAGLQKINAEELVIESSGVTKFQNWSGSVSLRVVLDCPGLKSVGYYGLGKTSKCGSESDFGDINLPALTSVSNSAFRNFSGKGRLSLPAIEKIFREAFSGCDNMEEALLSPERRSLVSIGSGAFAASSGVQGSLRRVTMGCADDFTLSVDNAFNGQPLEVVTFTGAVPEFGKDNVWPDAQARTMVFAIPEGDAAWDAVAAGATILDEAERKACHAAHPDWPIPFAVVDKSVFKTHHEQYLAYIGSDKGVSLAVERDTFFNDEVNVATDWAPFADGTYPKGTVVTLTAAPGAAGEFMKWYGDVPGGVCSDSSVAVTLTDDVWVYARFVHPWKLSPDRKTMSNGNFTVRCSVVDEDKRTLQVGVNWKTGLDGIYADDDGSGVLDLGGPVKEEGDASLWTVVRLSSGSAAWASPESDKVVAFLTPGTLEKAYANAGTQPFNRGGGGYYRTVIVDEPNSSWVWNSDWYASGQRELARLIFRIPKLTSIQGKYAFSEGAGSASSFEWWDLSGVTDIGDYALCTGSQSPHPKLPARGTLSLPSMRSVPGIALQNMENVEAFVLGGRTRSLTVTNIAAKAFSGDTSLKRLVLHADAEIVVGPAPFENGRTPDEIVFTGAPPASPEVLENLLSGVAQGDDPVVIRIPRGSSAWLNASGIDNEPTAAERALAGEEQGKVFGVCRGASGDATFVKAVCIFDEPIPGFKVIVK